MFMQPAKSFSSTIVRMCSLVRRKVIHETGPCIGFSETASWHYGVIHGPLQKKWMAIPILLNQSSPLHLCVNSFCSKRLLWRQHYGNDHSKRKTTLLLASRSKPPAPCQVALPSSIDARSHSTLPRAHSTRPFARHSALETALWFDDRLHKTDTRVPRDSTKSGLSGSSCRRER